MSIFNSIVRLCSLLTVMISGCTSAKQAKPGEWYHASTGLTLAPTETETNARCITVLPAGDTYYVRLQTTPAFLTVLQTSFTVTTAPSEIEKFTPPPSWMKDLPFWKTAELKSPTYYTLTRRDPTGITWSCHAARDPSTGVCYFVGEQLRD